MRILPVLFSTIIIFSCQSSVVDNVLPPAKMQMVLWDMMQADEMAGYYAMTDTSFLGLAKHADYYQKVFSVHQISKGDFVTSLNYYERNPAKLKIIVDSLQKFGQRLQQADSARNQPPVIPDTLKKLSLPPKRRL